MGAQTAWLARRAGARGEGTLGGGGADVGDAEALPRGTVRRRSNVWGSIRESIFDATKRVRRSRASDSDIDRDSTVSADPAWLDIDVDMNEPDPDKGKDMLDL